MFIWYRLDAGKEHTVLLTPPHQVSERDIGARKPRDRYPVVVVINKHENFNCDQTQYDPQKIVSFLLVLWLGI